MAVSIAERRKGKRLLPDVWSANLEVEPRVPVEASTYELPVIRAES